MGQIRPSFMPASLALLTADLQILDEIPYAAESALHLCHKVLIALLLMIHIREFFRIMASYSS